MWRLPQPPPGKNGEPAPGTDPERRADRVARSAVRRRALSPARESIVTPWANPRRRSANGICSREPRCSRWSRRCACSRARISGRCTPSRRSGCVALVVSDGPAGVRGETLGRARPLRQRPLADRAGGDAGTRSWIERLGRPAGAEADARASTSLLAPDGQPAPHAVRRAALRVLQRGSAAHRADRRRLRARAAGRRRRRDGQALRRQRLRDRALDARRAASMSATLRELYLAPFEAIVRDARRLVRDGGLQRRQRRRG